MTGITRDAPEQQAFPACVLPGCRGIAACTGEPCADCEQAFGPMLTRSTAPPLTQEAITARDTGMRDAVRQQLAAIHGYASASAPERKQNQTCWCCDERRTCTRTERGMWECDQCTGAPA